VVSGDWEPTCSVEVRFDSGGLVGTLAWGDDGEAWMETPSGQLHIPSLDTESVLLQRVVAACVAERDRAGHLEFLWDPWASDLTVACGEEVIADGRRWR
jgi:hypothetical protein